MAKLILLRHGQSQWNKLNRFTGWVDISLSDQGIKEAKEAGRELKDIPIDRVFTSTLIRAQMTATIAMNEHRLQKPLLFIHASGKEKEWGIEMCLDEALETCIPTSVSWHLNERFYGQLQGMNKDEARAKFGKEQVHIWRRSFDVPPPGGESLEMTLKRVLPYYKNEILPCLEKGENILISAHGNSLRSIVMHLEEMSKEEIVKFEIPTGKPLIYEYKKGIIKRTNG